MLMMWVCGDAATVVDDIDDKLVIQGVAKLLRLSRNTLFLFKSMTLRFID